MEEHTERHPDIHELIEALSGFISPDQAIKLVSRLPDKPERPATKRDVEAAIDGLRNEMRAGFTGIEARFDQIDARFAEHDRRLTEHDRRFDGLDRRFDGLEQRFEHAEELWEHRLHGMKQEIIGAFRGELTTAVAHQTRAMIVTVLGTVAGVGGTAVSLSLIG